jgi:hypothetical protein
MDSSGSKSEYQIVQGVRDIIIKGVRIFGWSDDEMMYLMRFYRWYNTVHVRIG